MRPLEKPQLELINVCMEELDWVACGIGREVLVESPHCDVTDTATVVCSALGECLYPIEHGEKKGKLNHRVVEARFSG